MIPLLVGWISGGASVNVTGDWFMSLKKPALYPPGWLFGVVWSVLYMLMGYACYRIWTLPFSSERQVALYVYALQLFLNFWWTFIFFKWQSPGWALVDLLLILGVLMLMLWHFYQLLPLAAWLNLPLLGWILFAGYLNGSICQLNG